MRFLILFFLSFVSLTAIAAPSPGNAKQSKHSYFKGLVLARAKEQSKQSRAKTKYVIIKPLTGKKHHYHVVDMKKLKPYLLKHSLTPRGQVIKGKVQIIKDKALARGEN